MAKAIGPAILIGQRLRDIRRARQMTQRQLAEEIDIDDYYISRLKNGHVNPTLATLQTLANALQIELRDFFPLAGATGRQPGLDKKLLRIMSLWPGITPTHRGLLVRFVEVTLSLQRRSIGQ